MTENIPRVLPKGLGVQLDATAWNILPVFGWLATAGEIGKQEMLRTFNCGIGAILICSEKDKNSVLKSLVSENPAVIGCVSAIDGESIPSLRYFENMFNF